MTDGDHWLSEAGSGGELTNLAERLDEADRNHRAIRAASVADLPTAYAVQREFVSLRSERLHSSRAGYKVALTSPAAQAALGSETPASGELLAVDFRSSGADVRLDELFSPLIEVELMFRLKEDLPARASFEEIVRVSEVAAGLECPDGRFENWFGGDFPKLASNEVISDNCLAGIIVISDRWRLVQELDLASTTAELTINGRAVASGSGAEVLGHPVRSLVWLSEQLDGVGQHLTAGTVVSSGTFTSPVPAQAGLVRADFSNGLGNVWVRFL